MSTRANVIIKDETSQLIFYRHSDGYPAVTGKSLEKFVEGYATNFRADVSQSAGHLVIHGRDEDSDIISSPFYSWKVGAYEPTPQLHADIEYLYVIDLQMMELIAYRVNSAFQDDFAVENCEKLSVHKIPSA